MRVSVSPPRRPPVSAAAVSAVLVLLASSALARPAQAADVDVAQGLADQAFTSVHLFDDVTATYDLGGFVYPQMATPTPDLFSTANIGATTVSEINLLGTPGVSAPGGHSAGGPPFCPIFTGTQWSDGGLLGLAFDYEQATMRHAAPSLIPLPTPALLTTVGLVTVGLAVRRRRAR